MEDLRRQSAPGMPLQIARLERVLGGYYLLRGGVFALLEADLVASGASRACSHYLASVAGEFNLLPRLFSPVLVLIYGVEGSYREILLFAFLAALVFSGLLGWQILKRPGSLALWLRALVLFDASANLLAAVLQSRNGGSAPWRWALLVAGAIQLLVFCAASGLFCFRNHSNARLNGSY